MADVEDDARVVAHRLVRIGLVEAGLLRQPLRGLAREEILLEVGDRLVGRLEVAARLRLEAERHRLAGLLLQLDQVRDDVDDVRRVLVDDVIAGDLGLEAERRALDRGIDALGGELREQGGHLLGVLAALRRLPVRLVDVFLDDLLLEDAVDEGVGGVEIEVLVGEELLERGALGRVRATSAAAEGADVRRQTPNFSCGAMRAFTAGR